MKATSLLVGLRMQILKSTDDLTLAGTMCTGLSMFAKQKAIKQINFP